MVEKVKEGKTYTCETCNCELNCTKAGNEGYTCNLTCCGNSMKEKE